MRLRLSCRGISSVLGAMIFILIFVSALASLVYVHDRYAKYISLVRERVGEELERLNEKVEVGFIALSSTLIEVVIENVGDVLTIIDHVWIDREAFDNLDIALRPRELTRRNFTVSSLTPDTEVVVVTRRGVVFQGDYGGYFMRNITISNPSGNGDLHDFQVRVVLTSENFNYSRAKLDGGDLRFYLYPNATRRLDYWIQSWNPGGVSIVWVKVPKLPAGKDTTIYMFYGGKQASSVDSFEKVADLVGEAGVVKADHRWTEVRFLHAYPGPSPPVVFASPSRNEADRGVVRIWNNTLAGFKVKFEEINLGVHALENIYWLALRNGTWTIGGLHVEVGWVSGEGSESKNIVFSIPFDQAPVVLTRLQGRNYVYMATIDPPRAKITGASRHGITGIGVKPDPPAGVKWEVGYLAIDVGKVQTIFTNGLPLETGTVKDVPVGSDQTINFRRTFVNVPSVVSKLMTFNNVREERIIRVLPESFTVRIDGPWPNTEDVGWLAVEPYKPIYGMKLAPQDLVVKVIPSEQLAYGVFCLP